MNRIAQLRKAAGLSQSELAKHLGIAQNTLSQYENEVRKPSSYVAIQMAKLFDVSSNYVLGIPDEETTAHSPFSISNVSKVVRLYKEKNVNAFLDAGFKLLCVCAESNSDGYSDVVYVVGWDRDPKDVPLALSEDDGRNEYDLDSFGWQE